MSPGNKAIDMMLEAYKDANNLYEQSQESEANLDINYDPTLYDCPDCYDDRNWKGKNPNCNHIPVRNISASSKEKIEEQELMHTGGYRDNALAVKAEVAKPIVWHKRWRQIWRAKHIPIFPILDYIGFSAIVATIILTPFVFGYALGYLIIH